MKSFKHLQEEIAQLDELIGRGRLVSLATRYASKAEKKGPGQAHHSNMTKAAFALALGDKEKAKKFHKQAKAFPRGVVNAETEVSNDVLSEKLGPSAKAADWIHDFVHSDDKRFAGKSKKERIKMALGAYYAARNEETVTEAREKSSHYDSRIHNILQSHGINNMHDYEKKEHEVFPHLFDHLSHEMPYGTAKARTGDPYNWMHNRISQHFGESVEVHPENPVDPELDSISVGDSEEQSVTKDEKDFVKIHKVKKTADVNGNQDDVFKATNVSVIKRALSRLGHEPTPQDQADYKP